MISTRPATASGGGNSVRKNWGDDLFRRLCPGFPVSRSLGMMGAQIILSPCAWAVPADRDPVREPYGALWRDSYSPVAREFGLWIAGVSNVGRCDPVRGPDAAASAARSWSGRMGLRSFRAIWRGGRGFVAGQNPGPSGTARLSGALNGPATAHRNPRLRPGPAGTGYHP